MFCSEKVAILKKKKKKKKKKMITAKRWLFEKIKLLKK